MDHKLIASILMLASNAIFTFSVIAMVVNHINRKCIQKTMPMFIAFLAILALGLGQTVMGLVIPACATFLNCALYLLIIAYNEIRDS